MVSAAVSGDGGYCEYGAFRVSRLLRPAGLRLLFERTERVPHLPSLRPESRCGCDVGDRLGDFSRACRRRYLQTSATEGTAALVTKLMEYRPTSDQLSPSTINVRLSA